MDLQFHIKPYLGTHILIIVAAAICCVVASGCASRETDLPPLQTVPHIDLDRFGGLWYEIARYPNIFQEDCVGSRARYSLAGDGKISVLNECYDRTFDGRLRSARGRAWTIDKTNAKLKVSFFSPFSGDYWIIDLGKDYEYAVIGHPERRYLWILCRTKTMERNVYQQVLSRLKEQQYDIAQLIMTPQK
jgi:apolipoprotein D and lipocalin family protein